MDDVIGKHLVMLAVVRMDCTLDNVEPNLASIATIRARRQARVQSHRHLLMAQQSCDDDFFFFDDPNTMPNMRDDIFRRRARYAIRDTC
jgi:hypothetical protein